ncbi:MAG: PA-phosphatase [Acetobacteraceae bacterium]
MNFLTDFADQAVILPLVLVVAVILAAQGWRRGAGAWLLAIGATFSVVLGLKLLFLGCQPVFRPWGIVSPSGHVAAATIVAGGLMALVTHRIWLILAGAAAAGTVVAVTRLLLGVHSVPEVCLGGFVGLWGAYALSRLAGPPPALRLFTLAAFGLVVVALFHGARLPAEQPIRQNAQWLGTLIPACRASVFPG